MSNSGRKEREFDSDETMVGRSMRPPRTVHLSSRSSATNPLVGAEDKVKIDAHDEQNPAEKAAELLALVDDASIWKDHKGEKNWMLKEMLPKGDAGVAELADIFLTHPHFQNNVGPAWKAFRLSLKSVSPEFKAQITKQLVGGRENRLKKHLYKLTGKLPLPNDDMTQLREELLALIVPFPAPEQLKDQTLRVVALLKPLNDLEVSLVVNVQSFIDKLDVDVKEPRNAHEYDPTLDEDPPELPPLEACTTIDVEQLGDSGAAFNCAETVWQQWLRIPVKMEEHIFGWFHQHKKIKYVNIDNVEVTWEGRWPPSPRGVLVSTLLRAMGGKCPPAMQFSQLRGFDLHGWTTGRSTNLSGSSLEDSVLTRANFCRGTLRGLHLYAADVSGCNFQFCDLTNARLCGDLSDKRKANFELAILKGCTFNEGGRLGKWDPAPLLPPQHTHNPKPIGLCRMLLRIMVAAGEDAEEEEEEDDDDDEEEEEEENDDEGEEEDKDEDGDEKKEQKDHEDDENESAKSMRDEEDEAINSTLQWFADKSSDDDLLLKFANDAEETTVEAVLNRLRNKAERITLWLKLEKDYVDALVTRKQAIQRRTKKLTTQKVTAKIVPLLDVKSLRAQHRLLKKAKGQKSIRKELIVLLRLQSEMRIVADEIDAHLDASKAPGDVAKWASAISKACKLSLELPGAPLANLRKPALLCAELGFSSAYSFSFFELWSMISIDARQLKRDARELELLASELDELMVPMTPLNWEDQLSTWIALMDLCGRFHGRRAQAVARKVFDDKKLLAAIGMANQLQKMFQGSAGSNVPGTMIAIFKEDATANLRRNKFTYMQSINIELANIERVRRCQSHFVASIGLFVFMLSNLFSLWLDRRIAEYEYGDTGSS
jgi:hypothetical protein